MEERARSAVGGGPASSESDGDDLVKEDGPWYMNKAREEVKRGMRDAAGASDDNFVQVCNT